MKRIASVVAAPATTVTATRSGQIIGTPAFASPEQLLGQTERVCDRSDVFSLGATLYSLLTGEHLMQSCELPEHLQRIQQNQLPRPRDRRPSLPIPLDTVCRKALSIKPEDRYSSAQELSRDIERFLSDEPVSVLVESRAVRTMRWLRQRPRLSAAVFAGILVSLIASVAGAWLLEQKNEQLTNAGNDLQSSNRALVTTNENLTQAIQTAEANHLRAMKALESLTEFAMPLYDTQRGRIFNEQEKRLVRKVLAQYREFSSTPGTSDESRLLRATGLMNCGSLLMSLQEHNEAFTTLQAAESEFRDLSETTPGAASTGGEARVLELIADCQFRPRRERSEAARTLKASIRKFDEALRVAAPADRLNLELHRVRAIGKLALRPSRVLQPDVIPMHLKLLNDSLETSKRILAEHTNDPEVELRLLDVLQEMHTFRQLLNPGLDNALRVFSAVNENDVRQMSRQRISLDPVLCEHLRGRIEFVHSLCERILERSPDLPRAQQHLAWSYLHLAGLTMTEQTNKESDEKCIELLTQGINVLNSLIERFPGEAEIQIALSSGLQMRSQILERRGDLEQAAKDADRSSKTSPGFASFLQTTSNPAITEFNDVLGEIERRVTNGELQKAAVELDDLGKKLRQFNRDRPELAQQELLSRVLKTQADTLISLKQPQAATDCLKEAILLLKEELANGNPGPLTSYKRRRLIETHTLRGRLLRQLKQLGEAKVTLDEGIRLFEPVGTLEQLSPSMLQLKAELLLEHGFLEIARKDHLAAQRVFEEELQLRRRQIELRPDDPEAHLRAGGALCNIGNQYRESGDFAASLPHYEDAIRILTENQARAASNSRNTDFLASTYMGSAQSLAKLNRHIEACIHFDKALALQPKRKWNFEIQAAHAESLLHLPDPQPGIAKVLTLCNASSDKERDAAEQYTLAELCESAAALSTNPDEQSMLRTKAAEFRSPKP